MMPVAYVAVGSNLGDRERWHAFAESSLAALAGVRIDRTTPARETMPLGGADQPAYLNRMMRLDTSLAPGALLAACHEIERAAGRHRTQRWASRTLDLDLVRYDDMTCDTPELVLPHAGLRDRSFWAREIAELEAP